MINSSNFDFSIEFRNLNSAAEKLFNKEKGGPVTCCNCARTGTPGALELGRAVGEGEKPSSSLYIFLFFGFFSNSPATPDAVFLICISFFLFLGLLFLTCSIVLSLSLLTISRSLTVARLLCWDPPRGAIARRGR
jgi:hypothetical protein